MAISKSSKIDFAAISSEMAGIVSRWFNGTIQIVDPNLAINLVWDEWTNTSTGTETVLWTGEARIQPTLRHQRPRCWKVCSGCQAG